MPRIVPLGRAGIRLRLPYRPPYDWPGVLAHFARRAIPGLEEVDGDTYRRAIAAEGWTAVMSVRPGDRDALEVRLEGCDPAVQGAVAARLGRMFDLDADPGRIASHLARDRLLAPLVQARPGLRVPGAWDGFELAVRAVLGQQITVEAAVRLAARLVADCGGRLASPSGTILRTFPAPAALESSEPAPSGMPRARAAALVALAAAARADPDLFAPAGGLEASVRRLCAIRGIGPWTAHYIALRQLREADAFPHTDVALVRAFERLTGRPASPERLQARAVRWQPWRGYAAQHLWSAG